MNKKITRSEENLDFIEDRRFVYSSIGKIPKDWEIVTLDEIAEITSSKRIYAKDYTSKGIPFYRSKEIIEKAKKKEIKDTIYISKEKFLELKNKFGVPSKGDLLITAVGTLGVPYLVDDDEEFYFKDGNLIWMRNIKSVDKKFLYFYWNSLIMKKQIDSIFNGSSQKALSIVRVNKLQIPKPDLKEQQKIADILSTWDRAIELKEKLIDQKKQMKKGLMQKLLTGEVRLPGFDGEWEEIKLGNIGYTYNGLSGKTKKDFGEGKPYIPYKTIFDDYKVDTSKLDFVKIDPDEKQNKVKYGDVLFTASSETPDEVGMSSVFLDNDISEIYLNSFCFGFRLNDFNTILPEFAQYLYRSSDFRRKTYSLAQGSTRFNLSKKELLKVKVKAPSLKEQKAVSKILDSIKKEIFLLEKEVSYLRLQKKGLMQLLLTGKVRVKV
ncbi:restriction endonuclease S subunit [Melghiribacillus thermohalophilus]|uniref:Restriction endonuclease S subunit n=1 Tax=Melghiribacillus thermohalophilus TaxID=1324956 RepID=A0A4R3MPV7_9BACI|nr:restriction endonuclease subunit S [Melghiribacillus thermohalophilus]TCT17573.1 restriction endonuclease S subunit [Melghiribacillus thermohalophilus]